MHCFVLPEGSRQWRFITKTSISLCLVFIQKHLQRVRTSHLTTDWLPWHNALTVSLSPSPKSLNIDLTRTPFFRHHNLIAAESIELPILCIVTLFPNTMFLGCFVILVQFSSSGSQMLTPEPTMAVWNVSALPGMIICRYIVNLLVSPLTSTLRISQYHIQV